MLMMSIKKKSFKLSSLYFILHVSNEFWNEKIVIDALNIAFYKKGKYRKKIFL